MNFIGMFQKVQRFMEWDDEKTLQWFTTDNPLLGGCTPMHLLKMGRAHKLEQFIDGCIEEAHPPTEVAPNNTSVKPGKTDT